MADETVEGEPLAGLRIALPETRQLDVLAQIVERRGAETWRCPLVSILDTPDQEAVRAWLGRFNAGAMDDLILLTGEGLRRLSAAAEREGCHEAFVTALAGVRKITRGPKPVNALRELGLKNDLTADEATTDGVIATLREQDLDGRTVGVQLYGEEPNEKLTGFLRQEGAEVDTVAPYVYADESNREQVEVLAQGLVRGELDAIAFTSQAQVKRLMDVAKGIGMQSAVVEALNRLLVVAVGPIVADRLVQYSVGVDVMPEESWFMKPMVRALIERLAA
ncbi:uroporphyrinogen-III synthase [Halospina sp. K52047b]|uniref:uroporphyrinogen-III synthase n=1 Tax=Halospina sp. K52047b TaxID=2614160 RepID=UPI001249C7D9|nr:uroporphyrinogen-III synthase [Halospina sp. K52047b]KAA8983310.1 uroporphyrinogen-III synthase [Halospina sp. K52047b]